MANQLVERGYLTQSLGSASHSGEHGFKAVPGLLKLVLQNRAWENRIIVETGEEFSGFRSFKEYIRANPPKGLGSDEELIDNLIGRDDELRSMFYAALRRPSGGDNRNYNITDNVDNINNGSYIRPNGTSKAYALQKLSDEGKIDLLEQVKAGKISANDAMKKAGFRRPRLAVALDDPLSAAESLHKNASPEFVEELKKLL
jgi:hypothetical protein